MLLLSWRRLHGPQIVAQVNATADDQWTVSVSNGSKLSPRIPPRKRFDMLLSAQAAADHDYLQDVAESVADAGSILITGPANTKAELIKHIHQHAPDRMKFIAGVETVDHPSDGALIAYARKYFKATDRMQPQQS